MQSIFVEVTFLTNENVRKKSADMLPKLQNVENFHAQVSLRKFVDVAGYVKTGAIAAQPGRTERSVLDDKIAENGAE